jgi:hypothetical protein
MPIHIWIEHKSSPVMYRHPDSPTFSCMSRVLLHDQYHRDFQILAVLLPSMSLEVYS